MKSPCPELEELDQLASDPCVAAAALHAHVDDCSRCKSRLAELSQNISLFAELGTAGPALRQALLINTPIPTEVGEFCIVREIGRGGMGVVYEATQRRPERRVALKVLRPDYAASEDRRRLFEREIRALALLRHVGIPAIYESGMIDAGPFYAMELVSGTPLTDYLRLTKPDLRATLRLFTKVCAAISYAHQRGVIHRDLKPGNILVEPTGQPKVLDFGLARIVEADHAGPSLAMDAGKLVGTLAYMSPEQARGIAEEIDLRSDVYSLCVILFELLTGALPYDMPRGSIQAAMRCIEESPPCPPSQARSNRLGASALQGDLDTIVLKGLEKSPQARYQSVAALSDDIERFLSDQPIIARPATTYYQIRKFARRHRAWVAGGVAVLMALGAGLVTTAIQAGRARQAERQARAEAATSAEINRFLTTMFAAVDPANQGPDVRVVQLLQRAAETMRGSFDDQPRVAIALCDAIGTAYKSLTLYVDAAPHLKRGLELARREFGPNARQTLRLRGSLAEATAHTGQPAAAMEELRSTLDLQTKALGAIDADTLVTQHFLAVLLADAGRLNETVALLRETLAGRTRTLGPDHEDTLHTMASLGIAYMRQGDLQQAGTHLRLAHERSLRARGADHAQTLVLAGNVATLARTPAELEAVEPLYRDIVERGSRVFGPTHQQTLAFLDALGQLLELRCKYAESVAVTNDLLDRLTNAYGASDIRTLNCQASLGRRLSCSRKYDEAQRVQRQVLSVCREVHGEKDSRTSDAHYDLAQTLNAADRPTEALTPARDCLAIRTAVNGQSAAETSLARSLVAVLLRRTDALDDALEEAERAVRDLRALPRTEDAFIAWTECNLGACLRDAQRFAEAEPLLRSGRDRLLNILSPCDPICTGMTDELVLLYRKWHAADPAGGHGQKADQIESSR